MGFWLRKDSVVYSQNYALDDLIVGSNQKDDAGGTDRDKRMWFNKVKAAFRAGQVTGTQWDDASVGANSAALGLNCTAAGAQGFAAGQNCSAPGDTAFAFGEGNTASNTYSAALGGSSNIASGSGAFAAGGNGITVSGGNSFGMGSSQSVTAESGAALGTSHAVAGRSALAVGYGASASRFAQVAHGGIGFGAQDSMVSRFVAAQITTNATPVPLLFDGGSFTSDVVTLTGALTNVLTIPVSKAHRFTIHAVARRTDSTSDAGGWTITGTIVRGSSGNASFITTPAVEADLTAGAASGAWALAVTIDTSNATNNYLVITATGQSGATIRWTADLTTSEAG